MIIDALLDLMTGQSADALILEPDKPPRLSTAKGPLPLSMPPIDAELFAEVLKEVGGEDDAGTYAAGGKSFTVETEGTGPGLCLTFRPADRPAASEEASLEPGLFATVSHASPTVPAGAAAAIGLAPLADGDPRLDERAADDRDLIVKVLERAQLREAADVFVSSGRDCHQRVGSDVVSLPGTAVGADGLLALLGPSMSDRVRADLDVRGSTDIAFTLGDGPSATRYRVNLFRQLDGLSAAFRPVRREAPLLGALGLPEDFHRLAQYRNGLVLMTGTAGSGKSTTLVALLDRLNRSTAKHILTIEDPIEYRYTRAQALIHQREVGEHVSDFETGLRAALREAPDVILVGEMRDRETIAAALTAAETGHLVLSTMHCRDTTSAVERIVDVFAEHQQGQVRYQLAGVLRAVVTQVLLPSTSPPERVVAYEKMLVNTAVAAKIREQRTHQLRSELHTGRGEGMVPLELTLARLVGSGQISRQTAESAAPDPKQLHEFLAER